MQIDLQPVTSSQFTHLGYAAEDETLAIRFHPSKKNPAGSLYFFWPVQQSFMDDFLASESLGSFFLRHIKGNTSFQYKKIEEPSQEAVPANGFPAGNGTGKLYEPSIAVPDLPEDPAALKVHAIEVSGEARLLRIASAEEYERAAGVLKRLVSERKIAQARVDSIKKPAYQTYQAALQLEHDVIDRYKEAERFIDDGMGAYRRKEREERAAAEEALRRINQEKAEREAEERSRQLAEEDAKLAEARGYTEEAAQIRAAPLPIVPVRAAPIVLPKDVPEIKGIIPRAPVWRWRVKPGEGHLIPRPYLKVDEVAINAVVRHLKERTSIPGIEVWDEEAKAQVRV